MWRWLLMHTSQRSWYAVLEVGQLQQWRGPDSPCHSATLPSTWSWHVGMLADSFQWSLYWTLVTSNKATLASTHVLHAMTWVLMSLTSISLLKVSQSSLVFISFKWSLLIQTDSSVSERRTQACAPQLQMNSVSWRSTVAPSGDWTCIVECLIS